MEATKRPWKLVYDKNDAYQVVIRGDETTVLARVKSLEVGNAIIRAVNEHDRLIADNAALVEALKTVHSYLTDKAVGEIDTDGEDERFGALLMCGHLFHKCGGVIDAALEVARGE
jgi:hypothetical protein